MTNNSRAQYVNASLARRAPLEAGAPPGLPSQSSENKEKLYLSIGSENPCETEATQAPNGRESKSAAWYNERWQYIVRNYFEELLGSNHFLTLLYTYKLLH